MTQVLVIIDVQNDYFPGGKMELYKSTEASLRIKELIGDCRDKNVEVIHIQHVSVKQGALFFLPDTFGVQIHENVKPDGDEKIFVKNYPNSFRNTGLDEYLKSKNINKLIFAGMMTHMCIDTTVRAAFDLGYESVLAGDCCATKKLVNNGEEVPAESVQNSFLAALNGTFTKVMTKDEIIKII